MSGVTFLQDDHRLASARLRNAIPMAELMKRGWKRGNDVIVLSKHNWTWTAGIRARFGAVIFDICDDYFDSAAIGPHYRHVCDMADLLTCNSKAMQDRIEEICGRKAEIIDDPYEDEEKPAGAGDGVLWFGNKKGLPDLYDVLDDIDCKLTIVTDMTADWCIRWTKEVQDEALQACRCVLVPPTKMLCRSANRAITAVRAGRMVVAGDIPSYREIPGIFVSDDYLPNLRTAMSEDMTDRIVTAQAYVRDRFSPERITDQWETALGKVL